MMHRYCITVVAQQEQPIDRFYTHGSCLLLELMSVQAGKAIGKATDVTTAQSSRTFTCIPTRHHIRNLHLQPAKLVPRITFFHPPRTALLRANSVVAS